MANESMIRLKPLTPTSKEYLVLVGDSSKKIVRNIDNENERKFTPFCFADFSYVGGRKDQGFTLDIGYRVSHTGLIMPGSHNQRSGNVTSYQNRDNFVMQVSSDDIIAKHRTLRLLSLMPKVGVTDMGDMRNAADLVWAYNRSDLKPEAFLRSRYSIPDALPVPPAEPKGLVSRIQSGLKTLVAEPAVEVKKDELKIKLSTSGIVSALESLPMDSNRRVIEPNTYVDLIVSRK